RRGGATGGAAARPHGRTPGESREARAAARLGRPGAVVPGGEVADRGARRGRPLEELPARQAPPAVHRTRAGAPGGPQTVKIILGADRDTGERVYVPKKSFDTHWHLIGGTGKGKTTAV